MEQCALSMMLSDLIINRKTGMKRYRKEEGHSALGSRRWQAQSEMEWNDEVMYRMMLILSAVVLLAAAVLYFTPGLKSIFLNHPCVMRSLTGCYCPGCGGSRAFLFLLHGQIGKSFYYNPAVSYVMIFAFLYMITHTVKHLTKGKIRGIHYRNSYCYVALILFVLNWIWKNYMLLIHHQMLIP